MNAAEKFNFEQKTKKNEKIPYFFTIEKYFEINAILIGG